MYPPVDTAGATGPENVRIDEPAVALAERVWDLQASHRWLFGGVLLLMALKCDVIVLVASTISGLQSLPGRRLPQMRLDMPEELVRDLLNSAGTDIVVIADDSGSMASVSHCLREATVLR